MGVTLWSGHYAVLPNKKASKQASKNGQVTGNDGKYLAQATEAKPHFFSARRKVSGKAPTLFSQYTFTVQSKCIPFSTLSTLATFIHRSQSSLLTRQHRGGPQLPQLFSANAKRTHFIIAFLC